MALAACSSPGMVDKGGGPSNGDPPTSPRPAPECAPADESTTTGAEAWGKAQGYIELLGCCVTPPVAQCQFLLSRRPKRVVIAVCNGERGSRRCTMNRTVTVPVPADPDP